MSAIRISATMLVLASSVASSQQQDSLPRVVITATRVDVAAGASISASTVIDRARIERTGVRDVAELLRLVPGVSIARSGGPGAQSSIFLRGGENDYVRVLGRIFRLHDDRREAHHRSRGVLADLAARVFWRAH